ncbi:MAG: TPM domain-containing protein [Desulforhopalus sp.]|nr:TPM domain-containing protein [Desulforhopalus sp.]
MAAPRSCGRLPACLVLIVLGLALTGQAALAIEVPKLIARVNDYAAILSPATRQQLEDSLAKLEREESTQIAVLTITSLQGEVLEEFSLKVAETWRLGQKGRDNGALLLIAKNDRKLRIEVGYGLEGRLTDLAAGRIIRDVITPRFREGNFDLGVSDGVAAMISAVRGEFSFSTTATTTASTSISADFEGIVVFLGFAFFALARIAGKHRLFTASLGAILAPVVGLFLGLGWLLILAFIPIGFIAGFLASLFFSNMRFSGGGWNSSSGGFSSGGDSGFSGGGGGFGGGGSSGGW